MTNKQPTQEELLEQVIDAMNETTVAIEKLREGDYYGDSLPDALGDIAKSLRILSGREQLKH
tara:strand:- start:7050 stop:7235 length:186 start_codon:yes stop_codon:yes gene_type:complete